MNILGLSGAVFHDPSAVLFIDGTLIAAAEEERFIREKHAKNKQPLEKLTGNAVVLNTSLNWRGEPMVCSPTDTLNMFFGSDLEYLVLEDLLVTKS